MLKNAVDVVGLKNDWIKIRKILGAIEYSLLKIKFVNIYSYIHTIWNKINIMIFLSTAARLIEWYLQLSMIKINLMRWFIIHD